MTDATQPTASPTPDDQSGKQIWDPALRAFHWLLALSVTGAWLLGEFGPAKMTLHMFLGYFVIALLVFRVIWGLVGPANARFVNFIKGPGAVWRYIRTLPSREAQYYPGHNPLGALSVVALLLVLAAQVATGLFLDPEDYLNIGPLAEMVSTAWNRFALGWHHRLGAVVLILVVLHVGAIVFYKLWKKEDLVTPMITGRRKG